MKYALLYVTMCFGYKTHSQILPLKEDQKYISNIYVSQCGYIGNETYKNIHCFAGTPGTGPHLYLIRYDETIESISLPDEIVENCEEITLVSSGKLFFIIESSPGVRYKYRFDGVGSRQFQMIRPPIMRGHDDTGPMD